MTRLEKEKVLENIYYDVEEGFGSVRDLYEKARKVDVGITLDMVSTFMRAQRTSKHEITRTTIPTLHGFPSMNSKST